MGGRKRDLFFLPLPFLSPLRLFEATCWAFKGSLAFLFFSYYFTTETLGCLQWCSLPTSSLPGWHGSSFVFAACVCVCVCVYVCVCGHSLTNDEDHNATLFILLNYVSHRHFSKFTALHVSRQIMEKILQNTADRLFWATGHPCVHLLPSLSDL